MLRKLMPRSIYDVMAAIACFGVLAGGTAYAANTVFSTDIVDGQVKSVDIGDGEIGSADVKDNSINTFDVHSFLGVDVVDATLTGADIQDGSLTANDVSENSFNVAVNVGDVPPRSCTYAPINGVAAEGDHMVLTPNYGDSFQGLIYGIEYRNGTGTAELKACNPTDTARGDGTTHFNLLVIQH